MKSGADFRPFRPWRYQSSKSSIGEVMAPPYDVISKEEQEVLYERSPYNCIRLILNKEETGDDETNNRYSRARNFFQEWKKEGVLIQESQPAFYLYQQVFEHPVSGIAMERTALLGRLKHEPFENQIVVPHEKTLSKPRADRRKLLETTGANFSPIFGLYEYGHDQTQALEEKVVSRKPLYETMDDQGVRHCLWLIDDPSICQGIAKSLSKQKVYIADGHHRYQTALEYGIERRKKLGVPTDQELDSDFVYLALVQFQDPGLVLLPTHRLLFPFPGFEPSLMLDALRPFFQVHPMALETLQQSLESKPSGRKIQMGLIFNSEESYLLTLIDADAARKRMPAGKSELWCQLDVSLISHLILAQLWSLPEAQWENTLRYTHSTEEAINQVKERRVSAAFLLRAPSVEILRDMGKTGELLPQKSTYFYPKLASGLLFYEHQK